MDDGARLKVNLRDQTRSAWWRSRPRRYAVIILGAILLVVIRESLERVSPSAGVAFWLGLQWLLAAAWVICFWLVWRVREDGVLPVRWMVLLAGVTLWFVGRAAYVTYAALI